MLLEKKRGGKCYCSRNKKKLLSFFLNFKRKKGGEGRIW